jgi:hypothetical protein
MSHVIHADANASSRTGTRISPLHYRHEASTWAMVLALNFTALMYAHTVCVHILKTQWTLQILIK